jgi:hypothetical protein
MDLRALGALLSALGGVFSAKAGATAGQLQGLLMGEELTERRKRMKMAEEAHQEQLETSQLQRRRMQQQMEQEAELFPLKKEGIATQVEANKLNLENTRLWNLFQQGVVPSQIADPVLRAQYEPFFNYQMAVRSLEAVQTNEDLEAVLAKVPEEWRPSLEMLGRANLFTNQMRRQMIERQLSGLDINLAQVEFNLRTAKLNTVLSLIVSNIEREGMDWDKRTPQQKVEAVKKWIEQAGLSDVVPENFANMFQRVKSTDARQFALYRLQAELQHRFAVDLANRQFAHTLSLQREGWWSNLVSGALMGGVGAGGGGIAPLGFLKPAPPPNLFTATPDNSGSYLNRSALNAYLRPPIDVAVPYGNGMTLLSSLRGAVSGIYEKLGRPNADITAEEINLLITYDAGLHLASAQQAGMNLDWNTALLLGKQNILPVLKSNHLYQNNLNYRQVVDAWEQAFERNLQQRTTPAPQREAQRTPTPPITQGGNPLSRATVREP